MIQIGIHKKFYKVTLHLLAQFKQIMISPHKVAPPNDQEPLPKNKRAVTQLNPFSFFDLAQRGLANHQQHRTWHRPTGLGKPSTAQDLAPGCRIHRFSFFNLAQRGLANHQQHRTWHRAIGSTAFWKDLANACRKELCAFQSPLLASRSRSSTILSWQIQNRIQFESFPGFRFSNLIQFELFPDLFKRFGPVWFFSWLYFFYIGAHLNFFPLFAKSGFWIQCHFVPGPLLNKLWWYPQQH